MIYIRNSRGYPWGGESAYFKGSWELGLYCIHPDAAVLWDRDMQGIIFSEDLREDGVSASPHIWAFDIEPGQVPDTVDKLYYGSVYWDIVKGPYKNQETWRFHASLISDLDLTNRRWHRWPDRESGSLTCTRKTV